jgi:glycine/D-amino acid oxidase-like deaminating enzyme
MHVAVIGAGAFGGWAALHLVRRGARVTLVDAWGAGNARSSSGGQTRVIRAVYGSDRVYVEMVQRALAQWEAFDQSLYVETGTLWLQRGDDAYVRASAPVLASLGLTIEPLSLGEAAKRYPQIDFAGVQSVWFEPRSGVLSAQRACVRLRDACAQAGALVRDAHARVQGSHVWLDDDDTPLAADAYVFACGPWLGRVFPDVVGDRIRPTRQEVHYFATPAGSDAYRPPHLPVWLDFGERIFYGIPDVHGRGFKVADDTRGEPFDPTDGDRTPAPESIARARGFLAERFPALKDAPLVASEVCQYENSADGHLILDRHPHVPHFWLAGGGSGHGFKLSPVVGEMMAEAILSGAPLPSLFGVNREVLRGETQFER